MQNEAADNSKKPSAKEAYSETIDETVVHARIARALSADYTFIYYVNTDTDRYVDYSYDTSHMNVQSKKQGEDFFNQSRKDSLKALYSEDVERFQQIFTKENILRSIKEHGIFMISYRLLIDNIPTYVNLKAMRIEEDDSHIVIGVNNIDAQIRAREIERSAKEERLAYSRIAALSGDYIAIYIVDPETEDFIEYSVKGDYEGLDLPKDGKDFFERSRKESEAALYEEDHDMFLAMFTREKVLDEINKNHVYSLEYRLMLGGKPTYVNLKAAITQEEGKEQLILGVSNIDARVKREQEYSFRLSEARNKANLDALTGVKNKHAYVDLEEKLNSMLEAGEAMQFAIVIFDVNGLKQVNDTQGHKAGDRYIKDACNMICTSFKRSPIFRIGGDEFAVIAQGASYEHLDEQLEAIGKKNQENKESGKVTVAFGFSRYHHDKSVEEVFIRADGLMYENKRKMKASQG